MTAFWQNWPFFYSLLKRDIKNRYQQSIIGFLWILINPAILLIIYYFIFQKIFAIKFELSKDQNFISFIAVGLWPWVAFSEAISNATLSMQKNLDLIKKINIPKTILVLVDVVSAFIIHGVGMLFAFLVLTVIFGEMLHFFYIPIFLFVYFLFFIFCYGLSLLLSSFQVFLRDVAQVLPPLIMIWFYLTPILYPSGFIPDSVKGFLSLNPISPFIDAFRSCILLGKLPSTYSVFIILLISFISILLGGIVFRRLSPKFEDMY